MNTEAGLWKIRDGEEEIFQALLDYCMAHRDKHATFGFSPEALADYLRFHIQHHQFSFVRAFGQIIAVAICWRANEVRLRQARVESRLVFNWEPGDPAGDSLVLVDVICTAEGALPSLLKGIHQRHPDWKQLKWFTIRAGEIIALPK